MPSKKVPSSVAGAGSILSTVAGPSVSPDPTSLGSKDADSTGLLEKVSSGKVAAAAMPFNPLKPTEYGDASKIPTQGVPIPPPSPLTTASTASESTQNDKVGSGVPPIGVNNTIAPLDRVRADSTGQMMTTNHGIPVADNQHSLKAGLRGPTLLEDFILREKITHFDHERIPERVVHARGSAAHGIFETYEDVSDVTKADMFSAAGKQTPVFVRFSTVAGERGSADTARDTRGFSVKFYTQQGNWDLVGNNIPVFFIQDAIKFPDLIHAVKPEPNNAIPQASSAHDTFWDFASLMPETAHHLMWQMSDRAIPRSYRTMQGFGVNTFRLVNANNEAVFVKFHWNPVQGTHSLVWDEAVKIMGADPDFHRRDLWEAIEAGAFPEYELGLQIFTEEQANSFDFDILDATKLIPEELIPLRVVGKLTLNRNVDYFFGETEQVAFCAAHVVPGIDFSNDPLLQGRLHSYQDTQLTRLGGPNFHEIPINAPIVQVHNGQRDGFHRQTINRGRVSYEPNSLAGGAPFQAGTAGFTSFPESIVADKVRGNPEKFAEHYAQAKMFFDSQTPAEQNHIANAFRFELTRVQTPAVRQRVLALLANVDTALAATVADGLGMTVPEPLPRIATSLPTPSYAPAPSLSLMARPGVTGIKTRKVAIFVAAGVDGDVVSKAYANLLAGGAVPRLVGTKMGMVNNTVGAPLEVEISVEAGPSVLYDAVIVPDGTETMGREPKVIEFLRDQHMHCKPMLVMGTGATLLTKAGLDGKLPDGSDDASVIMGTTADAATGLATFEAALAGHRSFARELDQVQA
jgi:catalase